MENDYLSILFDLLIDYKPIRKGNYIYFCINGVDLSLYDNKFAILLFENNINKLIVPIMLSCTDFFMFEYIKNHYIKKDLSSVQLTIFDFI